MTYFHLIGTVESLNEAIGPQGTIVATPSVTPLVSLDGLSMIAEPMLTKLDRGLFRMRLPAKGEYVSEFYLSIRIRTNAGTQIDFDMEPEVKGEVILLGDVVPLQVPPDPPPTMVIPHQVKQWRDEVKAMYDEIKAMAEGPL